MAFYRSSTALMQDLFPFRRRMIRGYSMPVIGLRWFAGRADQTESPKIADFYPVVFRQGLAHPVKNRIDHKLGIFGDEF